MKTVLNENSMDQQTMLAEVSLPKDNTPHRTSVTALCCSRATAVSK